MTMISTTKILLYFLICHIFIPAMSIKLQKIHNYNTMINIVIKITKSCHINKESSILVAGEFNANEIEKLTSSHRSVMILDHFNLSDYTNVQNTVQALVISPNSNNDLHGLLQQVKNSSMWNNLRHNIILSRTVSSRSCDKALRYLFTSWKGDLLNSIFLCALAENSIRVYTYNPYTDLAPKPWSFVTKLKDDNNYWYFYSTEYLSASITCNTLFFDKTHHLNGYTGIKAITYIPKKLHTTNFYYNYHSNVKKRFDSNIVEILNKELNITLVSTISTEYGTFDQKGNPVGLDKCLVHDHCDLLLDHRFLVYTKGLVQSTFTLGESGISFVTQHRNDISIFLQIVSYFRPVVIIFTLISLGLTVSVLKLSIEESFDSGILEVLRLFLNGPLLRVPTKISPRIFIFTILIFVFIMRSIFQTKILSFIMVPRPDNLNTFADLIKHQEYKIYCKRGFEYLLPSSLKSRVIVRKTFYGMFNDSQAAFIWEDLINIGIASKHHLHLSTESMSKHHIIQRTRRSWPLINRVNKIYMYLLESGISGFQRKLSEFYITHNHADDHYYDDHDHRVLNVVDLKFAFQILIFGLASSLVSFVIEIRFWRFLFSFKNKL